MSNVTCMSFSSSPAIKVLVAMVTDSSVSSQARLLSSMKALGASSVARSRSIDWALMAHDVVDDKDALSAWHTTVLTARSLSGTKLVTIIGRGNHSALAKGANRARLVWRLCGTSHAAPTCKYDGS